MTSITQLADPDDTLVAYIDTFIPVGGESTAVLFGRVLNVPVLDPANNTLAEGELLKVGENSVFEYTDSIGDRVGVVLRRITDGEVMDVLFSPFAAANPVHAQLISTNAPNSPYINEVIPVPMGSAVNVSQDTVITYSDDVVIFAHIDNNDSLQYDQPTGIITVSRGGTFELSVPNRIDFNEDLEVLMDLTPFSGSNTINIDLVVIRNSVLSGDEVIISGRFVTDAAFDSTQDTVEIGRDTLTGFDIPTMYTTYENFYTDPLSPKIIDCEVGDTIRQVFRFSFVNNNILFQTQPGSITINYPDTSAIIGTALTVKRI